MPKALRFINFVVVLFFCNIIIASQAGQGAKNGNLSRINLDNIIYVDIDDIVVDADNPWQLFIIGNSEQSPANSFGCWFDDPAIDGKLRFETYCKKIIGNQIAIKDITGQDGANSAEIIPLEEGAEIGPNSNWQTTGNADGTPDSDNNYYPNEPVFYHAGFTVWAGKTAYVGAQFKEADGWHYIWFSVSVNNNGTAYTLHDYAFNSNPGEPIFAGQKESSGSGGEEEIVAQENFESIDIGALPAGWTASGNFSVVESVAAHDEDNGDWSCCAYEGSRAINCAENWDDSANGPVELFLETAEFNLPQSDICKLKFYEIRSWDNYWPESKPDHQVNLLISFDGGDWQLLQTINAGQSDFQNWIEKVADLSTFAGKTIKFKFLTDSHHYFWRIDDFRIVKGTGTSVEDEIGEVIPNSFSIKNAYPNPFNPETMVEFAIPESRHTIVAVYNMLGQRVKVLADEIMEAGTHKVRFDAKGLSTGMYIYSVQFGKQVQFGKCIYLK